MIIETLLVASFLLYLKREELKRGKGKLDEAIRFYRSKNPYTFEIHGDIVKISLGIGYITLPFNKEKENSMLGKTVLLVTENGDEFDITHKCGIPYLVPPKLLGGVRYKVETFEDDEPVIFEGAPLYLD